MFDAGCLFEACVPEQVLPLNSTCFGWNPQRRLLHLRGSLWKTSWEQNPACNCDITVSCHGGMQSLQSQMQMADCKPSNLVKMSHCQVKESLRSHASWQ